MTRYGRPKKAKVEGGSADTDGTAVVATFNLRPSA